MTANMTEIDSARAEAFAERMLDVLNDASLALLTSVGHQVGLFDKMAELPPATSAQIAAAAGLQERYVREWLGGMTTGRVVEYDPTTRTYRLPAEHSRFLTRAAGPENLAIQMQYIPMMAGVEAPIIECFRSGGGVPYSEFGDFHRLMSEDSSAVHDLALVDVILPLVPGLPEQLRDGISAADIGCGRGHAINLMGEAFPNSRFTGYDFSEDAVTAARREATKLGLGNVEFAVRDAAALDERDQFDLITAFDAIHDQAHPARVLERIWTALRNDGVFLMVDIRASSNLEDNLDHMIGTMGYTISTMHCMTVSLAVGGDGLGTFWGEQLARQMLADAGFTRVELASVEADPINSYFIARK